MKSAFPYLVDISLSYQCALAKPEMCKLWDVCYASPENKITKKPSWDFTTKVIEELYRSNVFELVFGGESEPTTVKFDNGNDLGDLIKFCKDLNFVVGVTTRNYNLHNNIKLLEKIFNYVTSIAFSCNDLEDYEKIKTCIKSIKEIDEKSPDKFYTDRYHRCSIYIQDVLEVKPYEDFKKFIKQVSKHENNDGLYPFYIEGVTLLGYKDFGFGKDKKKYDYGTKWIKYIKKLNQDTHMKFGIDSILVSKYRDELITENVNPCFLVGREGSSSCYIDVMRKLIKPSSFTGESYPWEHGKFLDILSKF